MRPLAHGIEPDPAFYVACMLLGTQISKPTYYVKQQWTRSYKEMMSTIMQHIQAMEPNLATEEVSMHTTGSRPNAHVQPLCS